MWSIERLKLLIAVLVGISIPACAAGVFLARVHAGPGWYDAVGIFLAGLGVFRVMFPNVGIPVRYTEFPPRAPARTPDVRPPNA